MIQAIVRLSLGPRVIYLFRFTIKRWHNTHFIIAFNYHNELWGYCAPATSISSATSVSESERINLHMYVEWISNIRSSVCCIRYAKVHVFPEQKMFSVS